MLNNEWIVLADHEMTADSSSLTVSWDGTPDYDHLRIYWFGNCSANASIKGAFVANDGTTIRKNCYWAERWMTVDSSDVESDKLTKVVVNWRGLSGQALSLYKWKL